MAIPTVTHQPPKDAQQGRFQLEDNGQRVGYLSYSLDGRHRMMVDYVHVNPALRGKGMGNVLIDAAVDWARANKHQIVPICGYARTVLQRSPKYRDVLSG